MTDRINIEINGQPFNVENGKTIIEAADENHIPIPRFCYHKKLSVAANCRMCLVEVEKSRKPLPACATPVTEGMKIFTQSPVARDAQKAVMEFLLINHPLDCPICDQGGECELQDISLEYGQDISAYSESKRTVVNDNLGPLVATEMTRCIHCTRCVRFGEEIAGIRELGGTDRGEHMQIGTYVAHSLQSEISANIIDLCPVGALTSKPFQFRARAWEMQQRASIAPHDALGSGIELHVRRDEVMRVVPKHNEAINETWLSDRDRFSYLGINSPNRLLHPMVKENGTWQEVDWETALKAVVRHLEKVVKTYGADQVAALASPSSTLEELYLFQKWMRSQGINHCDHRLHQTDFTDQSFAPLAPEATFPYADLEKQKTILLVGTHLNHEQPLANIRVRKASLQQANIIVINPIDYDFHYDLSEKIIDAPHRIPGHLAEVVQVLAALSGNTLPKEAQTFLQALIEENSDAQHENISHIAAYLHNHKPATLILGAIAQNHPQAAIIRTLASLMESLGINVMMMTEGANAAGAWRAGMIPHRSPMGQVLDSPGLDVQAALKAHLKAYVTLNIEPQFDIANPRLAVEAFHQAESVIMITSFVSEHLLAVADVLLPAATYAETSGTYINMAGTWQTFKGVVSPKGEARPAWKIFRVLGNLFHADGFDYASSEEVLNEIKALEPSSLSNKGYYFPENYTAPDKSLARIGEWPIYRLDALCRQAEPLQQSEPGRKSVVVRIHPETAKHYQIDGEKIGIKQGEGEALLNFVLDDRVAKNAVYVPCALWETKELGHPFDSITIRKA